ncbi:hypothetical protein H5410_016806 [Solanum commersonii]|uniref:Uncharacterized protein n=1 Tax=Solanum commersonii TaxID=4109 RepID=A0A9J5ZXC9_SOLCO|nr:hypothetical protein H5410_016806 [Solanum commersonii]
MELIGDSLGSDNSFPFFLSFQLVADAFLFWARVTFGPKRYFDHRPTIRPNAKKLNNLLLRRNNMT